MAKITTNEQLVENRKKLGNYASFGGMALMFGGVYASFQNQFVVAYAIMIVGLITANFGGYYMSRWATGVHEKIGASLKGLDKHYRLYNYLLPVPNVLLTPYGVTVLLLKNQDGRIVSDEKGWRQPTGVLGSIVRAIRAFSFEQLGDPPKELELQKVKIKEFIGEGMEAGTEVPVEGLIVFTNPRADVTVSNPAAPTIAMNKQPDALKNALRRDKRTPQLTGEIYDRLVALFEGEAEQTTNRTQSWYKFWQR